MNDADKAEIEAAFCQLDAAGRGDILAYVSSAIRALSAAVAAGDRTAAWLPKPGEHDGPPTRDYTTEENAVQ